MKRNFLLIALLAIFTGILHSGNIFSVKVGFETELEGPFPTAVVFWNDTVAITWKSTGISGNVQIALHRFNTSLVQVIHPQYPFNDLPATYRIPPKIAPGKYYVRVSQGKFGGGNSNYFTIKGRRFIGWVRAFLEGISTPPQGFTIGQTLAVSWQTTEIIGQVTILLKSAQAPNQQFIISENRPYGDIPATYKLHNGILPGNFYAIVRQGTQSWRSKPFMINSLTVSPPWKKIEKKDKKIFKKN